MRASHEYREPTSRVKVLVMVDSLRNPGGGERLAVEQAIRLDPRRFKCWFCVTRWHPALATDEPAASLIKRLEEAGVTVVGISRDSPLQMRAWMPLIRLLRRERVEVVHGHLFGSNLWSVVIGRLAGVPAIFAHEHMWSYQGKPLRKLLDRELIARFATSIIAVSAEGVRQMIETERIHRSRIVLIENGVPGFKPGNGSDLRSELGLSAEAAVIGSVGHLRTEKAYDVLIDAVAALKAEHPSLKAIIAGEGDERRFLERRIKCLGLSDSFLLLGARSDVPDILAAIDVAVCCSDYEGGPLSVMEYMEAGLPVVATEVGGLPELVIDGKNGLLVPARDPAALATAIGRLIEDEDLRGRMGSAGRALRARRWGMDAWIGKIERLYAEALASKRR